MWKMCRQANRVELWRGMVFTMLGALAGLSMADDGVAREQLDAGQTTAAGLNRDVYESADALERIALPAEGQTPNASAAVDRPQLKGPTEGYDKNYVVHFHGQLVIDTPGTYGFEVASDDGARLILDEQIVIDHNGTHPAKPAREDDAELAAGVHDFDLYYFQGDGDQSLALRWRLPGETEFAEIPPEMFWREAGQTRVVAPGPKRLVEAQGTETPGVGFPLVAVHPMWRLMTIEPRVAGGVSGDGEGIDLKVAGMATMPGGRLAITTFDPRNNGAIVSEPNGKLWIIDPVDSESEQPVARLIDDRLFNPLGVLFHDGDLFVAQRDELTRFEHTGGGEFGVRTTVGSGWESDNYHHFTFGPVFKDGYFFVALSTSIGSGAQKVLRAASFGFGPNLDGRGSVVRIDPATGESTFITGGHRTPNGLFLGPDGEIFVGENQGAWQPSDRINHVRAGHFYGHYNGNTRTTRFPDGAPPSRFADQPVTPPAVHLPHNEIANSPTDAVILPDGILAGQLLVSDVKYGGLRRVSLHQVNGQYQGAVFRHSQGFNAGLNRLALAEDGSLYVGGIGERRSWSWQGTTAGLQRLDPTGETAFEFLDIIPIADAAPAANGLELSYTRPVSAGQLEDLSSYKIKQWRYRPTAAYGGLKHDEQKLKPTAAAVSDDRRAVTLTIPGLRANRVVHVQHNPTSDDGQAMWSPEAWVTVNQLPDQPLGEQALAELNEPLFRVLVFTKTAGFKHASIEDGVTALKSMATENAWDIVDTNDAAFFTDQDLKLFDVVVFLSTTGDVLDEKQQAAFERYFRGGGGFVGIHSATDTEYDWPWFNEVVGGYFAGHPKVQPAALDVLVGDHPSTAHLPRRWERTDEWYNFKSMRDGLTVLLNLDEATYQGGAMGEEHPAAWCREFDGGRSWYTAGGHTPESFTEEAFINHLFGGIQWAGRLVE